MSQPHGFGKAVYNNGDVYEGEFVKGERSGNGTYNFNRVYKYVGQWKHNCFWGEGKLLKSEEIFFEGNFEKGLKHGLGKYKYENGDFF